MTTIHASGVEGNRTEPRHEEPAQASRSNMWRTAAAVGTVFAAAIVITVACLFAPVTAAIVVGAVAGVAAIAVATALLASPGDSHVWYHPWPRSRVVHVQPSLVAVVDPLHSRHVAWRGPNSLISSAPREMHTPHLSHEPSRPIIHPTTSPYVVPRPVEHTTHRGAGIPSICLSRNPHVAVGGIR